MRPAAWAMVGLMVAAPAGADEGREGRSYEVRLEGRLMVDHAVLDMDRSTVPNPEFGPDDDEEDRLDTIGRHGTIVRRAGLRAVGRLPPDWDWQVAIDFRQDGVRFTNSYLRYTAFAPTTLLFGFVKEPLGFDYQTSAGRTTFMERATAVEALKRSRRMGIMANSHGDAWHAALGVFTGEGVERDLDVTDGYAVTGRVTGVPLYGPRHFLHLGVAASHRRNAYSRDDDGPREFEALKFSARATQRAIDAEFFTSGDIDDVRDFNTYGLELAGGLGPFHFQTEYLLADLNRRGDSNVTLDGWYVQAGYFLTGESKVYRPASGDYGWITPRRSLYAREGTGAWEVALRYEYVDLTNRATTAESTKGDSVTAGLNWYLSRQIRMTLNYTLPDVEGRGDYENDGSIISVRGQVYF